MPREEGPGRQQDEGGQNIAPGAAEAGVPARDAADGPYGVAFSFFVLRPIFSILLTISLILGGILGYSGMVKESNPDLAIPQAMVSTQWAGAPPDIIEKEITNKIEKKLKSLKGVKRILSGSRESFSSIAVEFEAEADLGESMQLLRAAVSEAAGDLPAEAEQPLVTEMSVNDSPIVTFMLYGDASPAVIGRMAVSLQKKFERISGVREVTLAGERDEIVRIQLMPERLQALGISSSQVKRQLQTFGTDMPLGRVEQEGVLSYSIKFTGRYERLPDVENLPIVRIAGGRVVRLYEVARVSRDLAQETTRTFMSWKGGEYRNGVAISLLKSSGRDTLELIAAAKSLMEQAVHAPGWPPTLTYAITSDQSENINEKLSTALNNGWQSMLCVTVILLFMLTWREALIAGLSLPVTFLGTVALLAAFGNTMNQLVIVGMVLALGMMVDVFILVMEGMHEGIFTKGRSFAAAAWQTVRTFAMPAFAGQLTTILSLAPLFAIGGTDGKFIRIIPLTTIVCLGLSFCIAFACSVPLSRYLLKSRGTPSSTAIDALTDRVTGRLRGWMHRNVLCSRKVALFWTVNAVLLFMLSLRMAGTLPSEMYPKSDGRDLGILIELAPGTELDEAQRVADAAGEMLRVFPQFESVTKYVGKKSPFSTVSQEDSLGVSQASHLIGFSARFIPEEERDRMAFEYMDELRAGLDASLAAWPGTRLYLTPQTGGSSNDDPVQVVITGDDETVLRRLSLEVQAMIAQIPGTTDIRDTIGPADLAVRVAPNREALDFHGLTESEVVSQMRLALENDVVGKLKMSGTQDDLDMRMGSLWPSREGGMGGPRRIEELYFLRVNDARGNSVPLASLAQITLAPSQQVIPHRNGFRTVTVKAKTEGVTAGDVLKPLSAKLAQARGAWPEGYTVSFGGEAESSGEVYSAVPAVLCMALFMVFAVMALLFGSFRQPFIIMFTVPMALSGTFTGFYFLGIPLSFPALIGIISLAGIVVNNAIVMVETMNEYRRNGCGAVDAAAHGAADRLRPIISTSLTTVVGLLPLAIADPTWKPLCLAIVFGLSASTVMALVIIPALYILVSGSGESGYEGPGVCTKGVPQES